MSGVRGNLCETQEEILSASKIKKGDFVERYLSPGESVHDPWRLHGRSKKKVRRPKTMDELFEDRVWLLFHSLGFTSLNLDRECHLEYKVYKKQVDLLARDEHYAFVVFCRTTASEDPIAARSMLEEFIAHHDEIRKALQLHWGHGSFSRVCHVVVLGSLEKREIDAEFVRQNQNHNLHLWTLSDIEYMEQLAESVGPIAKQQLYAVMFAGKRNRTLERVCPAILARIDAKPMYTFVIKARDLSDYVYVHHRQLTSISEASQAYQRMLRPQKLRQIKDYLDADGGFFANNIILNFTRPLEWTRLKQHDQGVEVGTVKLPGYYGCAWIIDGQHRLYGAAAAQKDVLLPVVALQEVGETEQASLFVEINKKQTSVAGNLLWDLYSDIYRGSKEPKEAKFWLISETAKRLGREGSLRKMIEFESDLRTRKAPLTLTTVCTALQQNCPWELLNTSAGNEELAKLAARIVSCYFSAIKELRSDEWENPKSEHVVLTNNGFVVFMMVFNDIVRHLVYRGQKKLLNPASSRRLTEEFKRLLYPAVQYVSEEKGAARQIVRGTGHAPQMSNALELSRWIHEFYKEFYPTRLESAVPQVLGKASLPSQNLIRDRAARFEGVLRRYVLAKLAEWYGDGWWKHGLPGNLKKDLDKAWQKAVSASPELRRDHEANKQKFNRCSIGQLADVIMFSENWDSRRFESVFPCEKNDVRRRVFEVSPARDAKSHDRDGTPQELLEAASSLRWFAECLGEISLNPYHEVETEDESNLVT